MADRTHIVGLGVSGGFEMKWRVAEWTWTSRLHLSANGRGEACAVIELSGRAVIYCGIGEN